MNFSGLDYGKIHPTDIDGVIEYHDKAFAFIEMKYGGAEFPDGQRKAIERLVNNLSQNHKLACAFICSHNVDNPDEDVIVGNSIVRACYFNGKWRTDGKRTLKQRLDAFMRFANSL